MTSITSKSIRQPIVTVCGHVDHGKTSILDRIRQSSVQETEAGGITQKISFTLFPAEQIKSACPLIDKKKIKIDIPGFLFIDTPGHAAFTNLRKRGGSLADLAILVIDINEGIKPQTAEVIQILKHNKTPFIIALNKIDNIHGWKKISEDLKTNIQNQAKNAIQDFNEKYLTLIGSLQNHGFNSDLFYNIDDFTKKIALVPCSAKTGEGIQELILMLCGLSQKYLEKRLTLSKDAKGVILEIKREKENNYIESILYDGELSRNDEIAVANINGSAIITRIRVLEEIMPLSSKFKPKDKIVAATGFRMQITEKVDIFPGMPFMIFKNNKKQIEEIFSQQIAESLKTNKQGIIAKADSLGSLEALLTLLKQEGISVLKLGIGNINKTDIISAKTNLEINELDAIIIGFNVGVDVTINEADKEKIKIITDEVIYRLIEELKKFREEKRKDIEKKRLLGLSAICKLRILHNFVFRNSNPAIFGVRVEVGKIIPGISLIDESGEKIGRIKNMQSENKSLEEAKEGLELAISIPGVNFERMLGDKNFLYSDITESQIKNLKNNEDLLSSKELQVLADIERIKKI
ncbi:MAG: translation initiation factor IF-2 [Candidatus Pacearchaeota archaeon]